MPLISTVHYSVLDFAPVRAVGIEISSTKLEAAFATNGAINAVLWNDLEEPELEAFFDSLPVTGFDVGALVNTILSEVDPEDWRVGESIAEAYLINHQDCYFPWATHWDLKNPKASPAGTDLVGFQYYSDPDLGGARAVRFAFSEVKTSVELVFPPSVMTGRVKDTGTPKGLVEQLENLRDEHSAVNSLILYLFRHKQPGWEAQFREACTRWMQDRNDVALFGILIRDVQPNVLDLRRFAKRLGSKYGENIVKPVCELHALYLPIGCVPNLPVQARTARNN